jgi:hypothetical protein
MAKGPKPPSTPTSLNTNAKSLAEMLRREIMGGSGPAIRKK